MDGGNAVENFPGSGGGDHAADLEGFAFVVFDTDEATETLQLAGGGDTGFLAVFDRGSTGDFTGEGELVELVELGAGGGLGTGFDGADRTGPRAVSSHDVVDPRRQTRPHLAITELNVAVALRIFADDVNLICRTKAEERIGPGPLATVDVNDQLRNVGRGGGGLQQVGERSLGNLEGLESLAVVAVAEGDVGLGFPLGGIDEITEHIGGGRGFVEVLTGKTSGDLVEGDRAHAGVDR